MNCFCSLTDKAVVLIGGGLTVCEQILSEIESDCVFLIERLRNVWNVQWLIECLSKHPTTLLFTRFLISSYRALF